MARLLKLGSLMGVAGTAVLSELSHALPLLICILAALAVGAMCWLAWVISNDRRSERLNLVFRGEPLPPARDAPLPTDPDKSAGLRNLREVRPAEPAAVESASDTPLTDPTARKYIAQLRNLGQTELADIVERKLAKKPADKS